MAKEPNTSPAATIKETVRVIYRPRTGGRPKVIRAEVVNGLVTINGGTHRVFQGTTMPWKGKDPWVIINQGRTDAVLLDGSTQVDPIGPAFLNEVANNRYAADTMRDLDKVDREDQKPNWLLVALLTVSLVLTLVFGIWAIVAIGNLHDALLLAQHAAPPTDSTVVPATTTG